ncbi:MAG: DUF2092 domain-containing protein [Armatimonadota bacterium]|nr:DUF2092 domain-containing protein [Armatimonadota bacterium]
MRKTTAAGIAALVAILMVGCAKPPSAKQVLQKTSATYQKAKTLRIEASNSSEFRVDNQWQGNGSLVSTEFERPNKVRQQLVGAKSPSVISDGKNAYFYVDQMQTYVQVPPERLVTGVSQDPAGARVLRSAVEKDAFKNVKGAKILEDETVDGVDSYVVQFTPTQVLPMRGMEKAKLTEKLWIGKQDFIVRKGVLIAKQKAPASEGKHEATFTLTSVLTKQEIDKPISRSEFVLPKGSKVTRMPAMPTAPPHGGSEKTGPEGR